MSEVNKKALKGLTAGEKAAQRAEMIAEEIRGKETPFEMNQGTDCLKCDSPYIPSDVSSRIGTWAAFSCSKECAISLHKDGIHPASKFTYLSLMKERWDEPKMEKKFASVEWVADDIIGLAEELGSSISKEDAETFLEEHKNMLAEVMTTSGWDYLRTALRESVATKCNCAYCQHVKKEQGE